MQSVSFVQIGVFIGCIIVVVGLALGLKLLLQRDPPLHKEYVSKAEHDKFRDETAAELKRHAARRAEIYEEQKQQAARMARVETENKNQTATLAKIAEEQANLRSEMREDNQAVQNRLGDVFTKLGEIAGEMRASRQ